MQSAEPSSRFSRILRPRRSTESLWYLLAVLLGVIFLTGWIQTITNTSTLRTSSHNEDGQATAEERQYVVLSEKNLATAGSTSNAAGTQLGNEPATASVVDVVPPTTVDPRSSTTTTLVNNNGNELSTDFALALSSSQFADLTLRFTQQGSSHPSSNPQHAPAAAIPTYFHFGAFAPTTVNTIQQFYVRQGVLKLDSVAPMRSPVSYLLPSTTTTTAAGEGLLTCAALREQHLAELQLVESRVDLKRAPLYKMPWYYHDPYSICGRYLLGHLTTKASSTSSTSSTSVPLLHRLRAAPAAVISLPKSSEAHRRHGMQDTVSIRVVTGKWIKHAVYVEHCGTCRACLEDVLLTARLVNDEQVVNGFVLPAVSAAEGGSGGDNGARQSIWFYLRRPGRYVLEVKLAHVNGSVADPKVAPPTSLGVIGIRASDRNRKSFKYNVACDIQRHVYGSPMWVEAVAASEGDSGTAADEGDTREVTFGLPPAEWPASGSKKGSAITAATQDDAWDVIGAEGLKSGPVLPVCNRSTWRQGLADGQWVHVPYTHHCDGTPRSTTGKDGGVESTSTTLQTVHPCVGDPSWMTDACGYNKELVWAPDSCRMRVWSPTSGGPRHSCIRRNRTAHLLLIGDSVTREYNQNCALLDLRQAKLICLFNNIALEGQHYSRDYAVSVAKSMVDSITSNRPGVFASNLGIHHMIGKTTTEQWTEFVDLFVESWKRQRVTIVPVGTDAWRLEKAVWLGPPTIHYARQGMGMQRAALWDQIAWKRLAPLGFLRFYAIPPTLARTESAWDGLHYASYKGKVQSPLRNRDAPVYLWNGGVSNMLFVMFLNLVCDTHYP